MTGPGTLEVERDYVWALETTVAWHSGNYDDPPRGEVNRAYGVLHKANFNQPRPRDADRRDYKR